MASEAGHLRFSNCQLKCSACLEELHLPSARKHEEGRMHKEKKEALSF